VWKEILGLVWVRRAATKKEERELKKESKVEEGMAQGRGLKGTKSSKSGYYRIFIFISDKICDNYQYPFLFDHNLVIISLLSSHSSFESCFSQLILLFQKRFH
jgi:hypothetical protein